VFFPLRINSESGGLWQMICQRDYHFQSAKKVDLVEIGLAKMKLGMPRRANC
jgi:hypothetical protein